MEGKGEGGGKGKAVVDTVGSRSLARRCLFPLHVMELAEACPLVVALAAPPALAVVENEKQHGVLKVLQHGSMQHSATVYSNAHVILLLSTV